MASDAIEFYNDAVVICNNCGNTFVTGSTKKEIKVDVCSKCHPFYTGNGKGIVEKKGQVAKFNAKYNTNNNTAEN